MVLTAAFAAVMAVVVSLMTTKAVEIVSRRRALFDVPNARSSHIVPTPRMGGIGIIAGVLVGFSLADGWSDPRAVAVTIAAVLLGLVGLADDLGYRSVIGKYLGQLATSAVVASAVSPSLVFAVGGLTLRLDGILATAITIVWLTAVINAFNFMDGIDGMVGSLGAVIGAMALVLVVPAAWPLLLSVVGASLGFLVWNHEPASIFMGDVGSQSVGLLVGGSLLLQVEGTVEVVPVVLLLGMMFLDTGYTLLRRARDRKDIFVAHREHLYQRLTIRGNSHRSVSSLYASITAFLGTMALAWSDASPATQLTALAVFAVAGFLFVKWVITPHSSQSSATDSAP